MAHERGRRKLWNGIFGFTAFEEVNCCIEPELEIIWRNRSNCQNEKEGKT